MAAEFTSFIWQHEYSRNKWKNFSYDEHFILNKAVRKKQKTVTLPSKDPKKKITVNLEKMFQINMVSNFQQFVRCIIYNKSAVTWSWESDLDGFISFTPKLTIFLELAYEKHIDKIDIFDKTDYEVDLSKFVQTNKINNRTCVIMREEVDITDRKNADSYAQILGIAKESERIIKEISTQDITTIQSAIFTLLPVSSEDDSCPLDTSMHKTIIQALDAEIKSTEAGPSTNGEVKLIPVDPDCPDANKYDIYCEGDDIYKVTLNFASLQANNNKYFIIELLKMKNKKQFAVWFHWGRTGYKGQHNLINCGANLNEAKSTFEKKFYDKTHNHWDERQEFKRNPSKYDLIHNDYSNKVTKIVATVESKLDKRIQSLLEIICNKNSLEEAAKEIFYDATSTPLGKITAKQIFDGYKALDAISKIIQKKGNRKDLLDACSNFYTKIPHDFGRKTPPILQSMDDIKEKLKMLETLSNIALAMDVINSGDSSANPIDKYYKSLNCDLIPIETTSEKFNLLKKCLLETHGPTHQNYTMELIGAFECVKEQEQNSFKDLKNNKLLWHGSRVSNWIGILKKGLQIAPPEAPSTGYMFGKGIYFADVSSKSANYCFATRHKNEGFLLLSEVALGTPMCVRHAEDLSSLPSGYNSVFGAGRITPANYETTVLCPTAGVPCGPLVRADETDEDFSLFYNEYIVYNINQVRMRYILRIKFNFNS